MSAKVIANLVIRATALIAKQNCDVNDTVLFDDDEEKIVILRWDDGQERVSEDY